MKTMTRQERFLTALRVQTPDRVPLFDFLFQQPLYETLIGRRPEHYNGRDAVACALALNHDGVWLPFGGFSGYQPKFLAADIYQDEWGTTYQKRPESWPIDAPIDYPIKTRADLQRYRPPDPTWPGRDAEIVAARDMDHGGLALLGGVQGPLTTAWLLMGYENICFALYEDPGLLALGEVKQKYGKRFCLIGNIDSSRTLPYGTPADVAAEVRAAIDVAAPGGGYILASDHSLHDGIPVENILELSRVGTEYGSRAYDSAQP